MDKRAWCNYYVYYGYFNYKFRRFNNFDENDIGIIRNKKINSGIIYNIGKRGQEMLKIACGI